MRFTALKAPSNGHPHNIYFFHRINLKISLNNTRLRKFLLVLMIYQSQFDKSQFTQNKYSGWPLSGQLFQVLVPTYNSALYRAIVALGNQVGFPLVYHPAIEHYYSCFYYQYYHLYSQYKVSVAQQHCSTISHVGFPSLLLTIHYQFDPSTSQKFSMLYWVLQGWQYCPTNILIAEGIVQEGSVDY